MKSSFTFSVIIICAFSVSSCAECNTNASQDTGCEKKYSTSDFAPRYYYSDETNLSDFYYKSDINSYSTKTRAYLRRPALSDNDMHAIWLPRGENLVFDFVWRIDNLDAQGDMIIDVLAFVDFKQVPIRVYQRSIDIEDTSEKPKAIDDESLYELDANLDQKLNLSTGKINLVTLSIEHSELGASGAKDLRLVFSENRKLKASESHPYIKGVDTLFAFPIYYDGWEFNKDYTSKLKQKNRSDESYSDQVQSMSGISISPTQGGVDSYNIDAPISSLDEDKMSVDIITQGVGGYVESSGDVFISLLNGSGISERSGFVHNEGASYKRFDFNRDGTINVNVSEVEVALNKGTGHFRAIQFSHPFCYNRSELDSVDLVSNTIVIQ